GGASEGVNWLPQVSQMKAGITRPDTLTRCALSSSAPPDATPHAAGCVGEAAQRAAFQLGTRTDPPRARPTAKIVRGAVSRSRLAVDQRHLRHRAAGRRAAFRAGGLATGAAALGLGLGNLLGLRRHRAVEIFEAELLDARFVLDRDDAHVAAALELAKQN